MLTSGPMEPIRAGSDDDKGDPKQKGGVVVKERVETALSALVAES